MASILRVPVVWTGLTGLPGVSVFFWDGSVSSDISALVDFFDDIKAFFPTGLQWTIPDAGDSIEDSTGAIDGFWSAAGGGQVAATGSTSYPYAAGVGARVRWRTTGLNNGRRVTGTTFLAPLVSTSFDGSGTIETATLTAVETAANIVVATGAMRIWSRPENGTGGTSHEVTSAFVPDRVTALRSRRY